MPEQRIIYDRDQPQQHTNLCSYVFDLGEHSVEVLENHTVMIVKQTELDSMVQLDHIEAYRLLLVLTEIFPRVHQKRVNIKSEEE